MRITNDEWTTVSARNVLGQKTKFKEKSNCERKERNYYEILNEEVGGLEDEVEMHENKVSKVNERSINDKVLQVKGVSVNKLSIDEITIDKIDSETRWVKEEHREKFLEMIE